MQSNAKLLAGVKIDRARLEGRVGKLRNASIREVGLAFAESIKSIESNLKLPHALMDRTMALLAVTKKLEQLKQSHPNLSDGEIVHRFKDRIWDEVTADTTLRASFTAAAWHELESLLKRSSMLRASAKSMLRANIALAWGAFECLAEDLAQITSKGTKRLSFRSLDKIRTSYADIFGSNRKLARILGRRNLRLLEQSRHIIMHKAGKVDAAFVQRTGCKLKPGRLLPLSASAVSRHTNAAITAGIGLLRFCDV